MKSKTKRYVVLTASLATVIVLYNLVDIKKVYMVTFHQTGVVGHFNSNGKIDGEVDIYLNGKVVQKTNAKNGILDGWKINYYPSGNIKTKSFYKKGKLDGIEFAYYDAGKIKSKESFKDGKREGPKITYYKNGQIEQSLFRKNDKDEGTEHAYYENGKVKYKRNWVNDKLYGDQYFYYENGKVKIYHTYDILGEKFYLSHYDESGKRSQSDGYEFSSNIYSKSIGNDSSIVLENNKKYTGIQDLYVTLANPPHAYTPAIKVVINNKLFKNIAFIGNNTAKIVNAFPKKGKYHIVLDGAFLDKSNMVIGDGDLVGKFTIVRSQ